MFSDVATSLAVLLGVVPELVVDESVAAKVCSRSNLYVNASISILELLSVMKYPFRLGFRGLISILYFLFMLSSVYFFYC